MSNPMVAFADAGWVFSYDEHTRFVGASHPLGGKFSVCEVTQFMRGGGENPITFHEVGHGIAEWFNRKSSDGELVPMCSHIEQYGRCSS